MDVLLMSSNILGGISSVLNGLFFLFIVIYPPKNLGNYKNNYYLGAFTSCFFAFTQCLCAFTFFSDGSLFLFLSLRRSGRIIIILFLAAHNSLFVVIAYNFVQRYLLISECRVKRWISSPFQQHAFTFSVVMEIIVSIAHVNLLLTPDESMRSSINEKYGTKLLVDFKTDTFYAISFERPLFGLEAANNFAYVLFLSFGLINILIMMLSGVGIYRFTKTKTRSVKLKKLNQRLLRTLSCQAIFSLTFVYMPGVVCDLAMLFRQDFSAVSPYVCSAMSCGTLFNPIADIILTSDYRKKISVFFIRARPNNMIKMHNNAGSVY